MFCDDLDCGGRTEGTPHNYLARRRRSANLTGHKRTDEEEVEEAQFMRRLRAMLSETELDRLWAEGKAMTMEQAIQLALA